MKKFFAFVLLLPLLSFAADDSLGKRSFAPRIINGSAAAANEHAYFVSVMTKYSFTNGYHLNPKCGGAHIGNKKVLTAAHCIKPNETIYLIIGNYSTDGFGNEGMKYEYCLNDNDDDPNNNIPGYNCVARTTDSEAVNGYHYTGWLVFDGNISEVYEIPYSDIDVHPQYNSQTLQFDIAVINLPELSNKPYLKLPDFDRFDYLSKNSDVRNTTVIGHGYTKSEYYPQYKSYIGSNPSAQLLDVDLTPRTVQECINSNIGNNFDAFTMVCAGDPGYDSCQGDSGGPLIDPDTDTLLGVVSWGPSQCGINSANAYGVYTNAYNLREWIKEGSLTMNLNADTTRYSDGQVSRLGAGSMPIFGLLLLSGLLLIARVRD